MDWPKKSVEVLIEAYQKEPLLFNSEDPLYSNKHARRAKLMEVARKVAEVMPGVTIDDCKSKFASLRSHFGGECRKIRASERSGAGTSAIYKPNVWWFPLMHFLRDYIIPRNTSTNIPDRIVPVSYHNETLETGYVDNFDHSYTASQSSQQPAPAELIVDSLIASQSSQQPAPAEIIMDSLIDSPVGVEVDVAPTPFQSANSECGTSSPYSKQAKKRRREDEGQNLMATVLERVSAKLDTGNEDPMAKFVASELKKLESNPVIHLRTKNKVLQALMEGQSELLTELEK